MALITGSTTIDWSTVTLEPTDFESNFAEFANRFDQVLNEPFQILSATPTQVVVRFLNSGATAVFTGSGFDTPSPVITSFNYSNPSTGDVLRFTGAFDFIGNEIFNSMTIGFPGFRATMIGNLVLDTLGNLSGAITQLRQTIGSDQVTVKGNLVLSPTGDISGTVTQLLVRSGSNTITMTGLSLPFDSLASVTTVNDLFSVVGTQLTGNDTITYTNNSGTGMTFFGGAGNDTITINGLNGDTLNGGTGNDMLAGGLGQDTVNGEAGND